MTFREVAIINFKKNIRNFFSYFICSAFSITIFFLYAALLFNKSIREGAADDAVEIIFTMSMVALALFAVFFINYAHTSFIKSRSKEFGIFMSLGMNKGDLQRLTLLENAIISITSIAAGVVIGALFSGLFQNAAIRLLDLQNVSYSLGIESFIVTIAVFAVIFAVSQLLSSRRINKLDIADLLREARKQDGAAKKNNAALGLAGIGLMLVSIVFLIVVAQNESLNTNPVMIIIYILLSFTGMYMIIAHLGHTLIAFVKGMTFYYHHILSITEINHKFNQNKRIIFILSILSGMTIFMVASPFSLLQLSSSIAERNKFDVEYVAVEGIHKLDPQQLKQIMGESKEPLKDIKETPFLHLRMNLEGDKYDALKTKPVLSQDTYNSLTGQHLEIKAGEAVNIITAWEPGTHGISEGASLQLSGGGQAFDFKVVKSYHGDWFATPASYPSSSGIVVSNEDFAAMQAKAGPGSLGTHYGISFANWKETEGAVEELKSALQAVDQSPDSGLFQVASKIGSYKELKKNYSLFFFVTSLIGALFLIAGGMVLYFKQYTELGNAAVFFRKLHKVGISDREVKRAISAELLITFFMPLLLGTVFGYCFIYFITHMVNGSDILGEFMKNTTIVVVLYFILQFGFYLVTKRKYSGEILKKLGRSA